MGEHLVVIQPHFDDAALSAGQLIVGHHSPVVVTVCSGTPDFYHALTTYDENCGFDGTVYEVIRARDVEDDRACQIMGANRIHLDLVDGQYRQASSAERHNAVIEGLLERFDRKKDKILAPLATKHPDHVKVMEAALKACKKRRFDLWLYEELPHRVEWPEVVEGSRQRIMKEFRVHLELDFLGTGMIELKEAAVACYESQLWALNRRHIFVPERFHKVTFR